MTPYLTCDAAIELLESFVDGELPMAEQVAVESHLRWCQICEARVADMQLVGNSIRLVAQAMPSAEADPHDLAAMQSAVLTRVRAERDQSFGSQVAGMFVDLRRLLLPALGATAAVATCVFGAVSVYSAATAEANTQSMHAMIERLANPGSDGNPLSLGRSVVMPRNLNSSLVLDEIMEDDAVYALSAVVTREGRVSNYGMLLSEVSSVRRRDSLAESDEEAAAIMDALKRSRFAPAQSKARGTPVAVNVVWLVTRTTVKPST